MFAPGLGAPVHGYSTDHPGNGILLAFDLHKLLGALFWFEASDVDHILSHTSDPNGRGVADGLDCDWDENAYISRKAKRAFVLPGGAQAVVNGRVVVKSNSEETIHLPYSVLLRVNTALHRFSKPAVP